MQIIILISFSYLYTVASGAQVRPDQLKYSDTLTIDKIQFLNKPKPPAFMVR